jgi:hypothetical protein
MPKNTIQRALCWRDATKEQRMRMNLSLLILAALPLAAQAAGKPCDELKQEIQAKLDAKGVQGYSLEVVAQDAEVTTGKVVGTCEAGSKKIVYTRG